MHHSLVVNKYDLKVIAFDFVLREFYSIALEEPSTRWNKHLIVFPFMSSNNRP